MAAAFRKKYVALAAPSGGGKSTLSKMLLKRYPALALSISFTTRAPRGAERNGVEYNFVSREEFEALIQRKALIEWAKVHDNYYGTSREFLEKQSVAGNVVLLDIDVQGVDSLKAAFGPDCLSIFILPPDMETLERRLRGRGTDDEQRIQKRLVAAKGELAQAGKFDHQVVNAELDASFRELCSILEREVGLA